MTRQSKMNTLLIFIYSSMILNHFFPFIRFELPILNALFALVTLFIPAYLVFQCFRIKKLFIRLLSTVLLIPISLISLLFVLFIGLHIGLNFTNGYDASSENIKTINATHYTVVAYRINPGAMSSYSIAVCQEMNIGCGLKLVKTLYSKNHKADVNLELQDNILKIDDNSSQLLEHIYFK